MPEQPDLILTPFGENAPSGAIDTIPEQRSPGDPPQRASWQDGFPTVTMQPLASGGIPPRGQDFNGVLKAISEHVVFQGGGGQYAWSQEWVDANGGYPAGAVLASNDGMNIYVSTVDNNDVNFNTTPSSIGNQWLLIAGTELSTVVPQAEAEAGTATTRRAWTAQRVRQAITGWWSNIRANNLPLQSSVPQVPDAETVQEALAGLGLLGTNFATAAEARALESLTKLISPGRLGDAMNAHVLGMGQAWQDMSSQREAGVTYTNTTGKTIYITISASPRSSFGKTQLQLYSGGQFVERSSVGGVDSGDGSNASVSTFVLAGENYYVQSIAGTSIFSWMELR